MIDGRAVDRSEPVVLASGQALERLEAGVLIAAALRIAIRHAQEIAHGIAVADAVNRVTVELPIGHSFFSRDVIGIGHEADGHFRAVFPRKIERMLAATTTSAHPRVTRTPL